MFQGDLFRTYDADAASCRLPRVDARFSRRVATCEDHQVLDIESRERRYRFRRLFVLVFIVLTASNCGGLVIGWNRSGDLRAWWPYELAGESAISFAYAALYAAIMRGTDLPILSFSLIYNSLLAVVLLLHAALFYGAIPLVDYQAAIRSDAAVFGTYGMFLIGAGIAALLGKRRPK